MTVAEEDPSATNSLGSEDTRKENTEQSYLLDQAEQIQHNSRAKTRKGTIIMKKKQGHKYPKRTIFTTHDPKVSQAFYATTDADAPLRGNRLAAGTVQHPNTGQHQVWLSTNGLDVICLAAYRDPDRADTALESLKAFLCTSSVHDEKACATTFGTLREEGDSEPLPLPDEIVRQIGRSILRRVVDGPLA